MNKMLTFFTAPVTAFFYPPVYQDAAKNSAARGVLYSLYLAGISVVLVMIFLSAKVMPQADAFVNWLKTNMPVLIWTPAGLSLENGQNTATLLHPQYGMIALFDMNKTAVTEADMGNVYFFVTSKKVFLRRAPGRIEERDITGSGIRSSQRLPPRVRIDGDVAVKMYRNIKRGMAIFVPFLILLISFIFFLVANLFYSLAGFFLISCAGKSSGTGLFSILLVLPRA